MNYFQFHIGDYAAATAHLSILEDAIYSRLLRRYYTDEKPIPADLAQACRLVGARSDDEREAVRVVLGEFFTLTDDGYRNKRADREIDAYHRMKKGGANGASKRWAKGGDGEAMPTPCPPHRQANANQEPVPINQEPEKQKHERVPRSVGRFEDFWQAYPNKKGRKDAEKAWARKGLDAQADLILADVRRRQVHDRDWQRGYVPHGSTYVNAEGWRDGLPPVPLPQTPQMQPSRQMQAIQNILGVTLENDSPAGLVLDLDASRPGADVRALPARFAGG